MSPLQTVTRFGDQLVSSDGRRGPAGPDPEPIPPKLNEAERAALHALCEDAGQLIYIPNENTTGLLPYYDLTDLIPFGDSTKVQVPWGAAPLRDRIVWAGLNPSTSAASSMVNCAVAGPRPDLAPTTTGYGLIRETNNTVKVWSAKHSLFNPLLWTMPELDPPGGAWDLEETLFLLKDSIGIRGGRMQMEFCELVNIQDPFNLSTALTSLTTDELITNGAYIRHCWAHRALFYRGTGHSQPEGTHSDIRQWSKPMYLLDEYNLYGGPNGDVSGYDLNPGRETSDGARNAAIMAQQENDYIPNTTTHDPLRAIRNVTVRRNLFWMHPGNGWNINHHYNTSYPNPMTTVSFADNLHVRRADGKYVIANLAQYAGRHSNHRIVDIIDGNISIAEPVVLSSGS